MMVVGVLVLLFVGSCAYDDEQSALLQARIETHQAADVSKAHGYTYFEGTIHNAEYDRTQVTTESAAKAECDVDSTCLGVWQGFNSKEGWVVLRAGSRTWSKGVPNDTVLSVQVKTPPYVQGTIHNAEYSRAEVTTESAAKAECDADSTCLGVWQGLDGKEENWLVLRAGSRTWGKGVPNDSVLSVEVKQAIAKQHGPYQKTDLGAELCLGPSLSSTECEAAAVSFGIPWDRVDKWSNGPAGCFTNDRLVYFNTLQTGAASHPKWRLICQSDLEDEEKKDEIKDELLNIGECKKWCNSKKHKEKPWEGGKCNWSACKGCEECQ